MASTRKKATWRLPCFVLGAALGIGLTIYTLSVRLDGTILACDGAVMQAFQLGCVEARAYPKEKCEDRFRLFQKDFEDITRLRSDISHTMEIQTGLGFRHISNGGP